MRFVGRRLKSNILGFCIHVADFLSSLSYEITKQKPRSGDHARLILENDVHISGIMFPFYFQTIAVLREAVAKKYATFFQSTLHHNNGYFAQVGLHVSLVNEKGTQIQVVNSLLTRAALLEVSA